MKQYPDELSNAIGLFKEGKAAQSRDVLRDYICDKSNQFDSLLWLAKVTPSADEAIHAAELAFFLDPENEIARRAIAAVRERFINNSEWDSHIEIIKLTGLSEAQARVVNWPFRGLQKPIGLLLDDHTLSLKDLAWAIQNATDVYIQKAARTLLLSSLLGGKAASPQPARVINGLNFSRIKERQKILWFGIAVGVSITLSILTVVLPAIGLILQIIAPQYLSWLSMVFFFISLAFLIYLCTGIGEIENLFVGQKGEESAYDLLRASLPRPWVIIRNLSWVDRKWGDMDLVLVGPSGVWVLEVKAYSTQNRVSGSVWKYKSRFGWIKKRNNPGEQAQRNSIRLREYLNSKKLNTQWIQPVVIWAGNEKLLVLDDPEVPVWTLNDLQNQIENLWQKRKLTEDQITSIADVLEATINKVKDSIK